MAKWIEYDYVCNAEKGINLHKKVEYSDANLVIAEAEACNGEYTITEDSEVTEVQPVAIELGGTGAKTAAEALVNLGAAPVSHGNHVPAVQVADNKRFLRNDNTWQDVTPANIGAAQATHTHAAGDVTSGTFAADRIPSLAAGKITSGTFATDRIPALAASKITSGTFDAARIPTLAASKVTTGTFAATGVVAKTGTDYTTARIRNIQASTTDLTAGTSSLSNGNIYLCYE